MRKNLLRTIYEKFYLYIYIVVPLIIVLLYGFCYYAFDFSLIHFRIYNDYNIAFATIIIVALIMLTRMIKFLLDSEHEKLLIHYNHHKTLRGTFFIGALSLALAIILAMIKLLLELQAIFLL